MLRMILLTITVVIAPFPTTVQAGDAPQSLMTRISEWRYRDAEVSDASMSDCPTINSQGHRTVPSIQCKTVLTTSDPIDKVIDFYRSKLDQREKSSRKPKTEIDPPDASGRSVTFHSDSTDRPVAIHIITVNQGTTSTTLVISRAKSESKTHIAWSQYESFP